MQWTRRLLIGGATLVLVGAGNWYTGERKVGEYGTALAVGQQQVGASPSPDFPRLDARMTEELLAPLRRAGRAHQHAADKLEFYQVVRTGGRMLTMLGLGLCATAGLAERARRRSLTPPFPESRSY